MEYASEETIEEQNTARHPAKPENKHTELVNKIRKKLTDSNDISEFNETLRRCNFRYIFQRKPS